MLPIIYQEEYFVAINKPNALLVHKSNIAKDVKEVAVQQLRDQLKKRVYLLHRLDRPTSGVLLFALSKEAAAAMGEIFQNQAVEKTYYAIVRGYTEEEETVDYALKKEMKHQAQEAITHYKTLAQIEIDAAIGRYSTGRYSLVKIQPKTGRMHQIRRHFSHLRHPIIGDKRHGDVRHNRHFRMHFNCHTLLLLAQQLQFTHPYTNEEITIQAEASEDMKKVCAAFNWTHLLP